MNIDAIVERVHARYSTTKLEALGHAISSKVLLSDETNDRLLTFVGGRLVVDGLTGVEATWDYSLAANSAVWDRLLNGELDLMRAIGTASGLRVTGNMVKFGSDAEVLFALFDFTDRYPDPKPVSGSWTTQRDVTGHYVDVNGIRTYFERVGSPDLPVILAIHTAGRDGRQWQQVGDQLADKWQVIAVDLPGHGKSWPSPDVRSYRTAEEIAEFIADFWEAAKLATPLVVMGCSMGANLVVRLAATYHDDIRAAICLQGADHSNIGSTAGLKWMDHPQINPKTYFRPRTFSLVGRDVPADRLDYLLWESEAYTGTSIQADMSAYITGDSRELTPSITCPMLMVRGQDDWMVTDEMVESTISRLPAETPVTLLRPAGLGHFAHVEQPETVAGIVRSFLDELIES